jgi:Holliday junction resolvase RusA-like endonuclease
MHLVFVAGVPRPQGSMQLSRDPRTGREFVKYSSPTLEWRRTLHVALGEWWQGQPPLEGVIAVEFVFLMPRPRSHVGAKGLKASAPYHHTGSTSDLDKLCRCVNDAMTEAGIWIDDGFVARMFAEKRYASGNERTGVHIKVSVL